MTSNRKRKIAHVVLNLDIGGLETLVVNMIKGLGRNRFEPIVVCLRIKGALADQIESLGVKVYSLGSKDKLEVGAFFRLAKILRSEKVDVVHTHNTAGWIYGGMAAILAGFKRVIHTEHGRVFPDTKRRMVTERVLSWFAYRVVAVSEDMKRRLIEHVKINSKKIDVIYNGVDTEKFKLLDRNTRYEIRNTLGIAQNDIVIGNVARFDPVKDHATLLKAFALMKRNMEYGKAKMEKPLKFLLVGNGVERENIENLIKSLSLQSSVICLGTRSDICDLMNIMDVFVLSSKNEGFSLTLLEAMACGIPVVATRVGGNPEIVKEGVNGFLCESENPEALAETLLRSMVSRKWNIENPFSLKEMIKQYEELYV